MRVRDGARTALTGTRYIEPGVAGIFLNSAGYFECLRDLRQPFS